MAFELDATDDFKISYHKLVKKNAEFKHAIDKKVERIRSNPFMFKPLRGELHGQRRAHLMKSFVIKYAIEANLIVLLNIEHHDNAYD